MGRKAKPAAIAEAQGNPGKRARRPAAPEGPAPIGADAPPAYLKDKAARKVWAEVSKSLANLRLLRQSDSNALAAYCQTVAQYWQATAQLARQGSVYESESNHGKLRRKDPLFDIQQRLLRSLQTYESEFGLTPAARQRLLNVLAGLGGLVPRAPEPADPPAPAEDAELFPPASPLGLLHPGTDARN